MSLDNKVLVSILTPSYNAEKYLAHTLESVIAQTFQAWELLVVDDCSPDNSNALIESYVAKDSRIKLVRLTENSGAAVARNKAIELARGRYIAFLDSDDRWLPSKLEKQIRFMQDNDVAFSYTAYEKRDGQGNACGVVGVPSRVSYTDLLKVCSIGCLTAMYDTAKLGKVYMPLIRKRQDLGLWLRILKQIPYAYGVNEVLAQYQVRSDSISADKRVAAKYTWRLYRDIEKLCLVRAGYYFSHYAFNGFLRTKLPGLARRLGILNDCRRG
ncbi:glycosyltransferase family 2 protein [Pseudomonas saudiphocaensis]|uniref:glycosyltransferase family 2 protein n=1 Tax=Pseudomonas saudiphocaensis TaxID=1499686 RepID=UPI000F7915A3|nr:glycosyltransferase family 2 protein [Pseudomonas saudiphocaensis]RRV17558.1 glycosyltransferase family 2 protein [Pseudomonas saudiphocaensis]